MVDRESEQRTKTKQTPVVANNTGYINKQALLDEFEKWNFGKHGQLEKYFSDRVFAIIDKVPTADVQEVRHGRWIVKDLTPYCSVCHRPSEYECDGVHSKPLFCPNCGAKMGGKEAEAKWNKRIYEEDK